MSMYGLDTSFYDYGFSDPSITNSIYGNPMTGAIDYDDELYFRRRPPIRRMPQSEKPSTPPEHRHDGTSPLPLGMDWSLPPRIWEGRNSVWPHDSNKKWSYCVTIPSWSIMQSANGSDTTFFKVQVGMQSPEGITTTRDVLKRFNDFLKLYSELKKEFPKKNLPQTPPKRLTKIRSKTLLEERRCALEVWMEKLLSDVTVSRTADVAIFLELEAAARQSFSEMNMHESVTNSVPSDQFLSNTTSLIGSSSSVGSYIDNICVNEASENQNDDELNVERERCSDMERDFEEVTRKCMELELRLTIEQIGIMKKLLKLETCQDARAYAESVTGAAIKQNEMLRKELDGAKKEVEYLKTSYSELKQEFNECLKDKVKLENKEASKEDATMTNEIME